MPDEANEALRDAIERVGGLRAFGRLLDVSHQAVAQWKQAPSSRVLDIERVSGVPRFRLRPDLFPEQDTLRELAARAALAADAARAAYDVALEAVARTTERAAERATERAKAEHALKTVKAEIAALAANVERAADAHERADREAALEAALEAAQQRADHFAHVAAVTEDADRAALGAARDAAERAAKRAADTAEAERGAHAAYERAVAADMAAQNVAMAVAQEEKRIRESFSLVSNRMDQMGEGLRELQNLATGVGDLKRGLSEVKSRGSWAEVQLRRLLEYTLTQDQFATNVKVRPDSRETADFAVRLPGRGEDGQRWLVIDVKFPIAAYERLLASQGSDEPGDVAKASAALERTIRLQAKTICEAYIRPPYTTDFAILYLPTEALFAEVIRCSDLMTDLWAKRIIVQGPTMLAVLLGSLKTAFAIEQRSSDMRMALGAAKAEFEKSEQIWEKLGKRLDAAWKTAGGERLRPAATNRKLSYGNALDPELRFAVEEATDLALREFAAAHPDLIAEQWRRSVQEHLVRALSDKIKQAITGLSISGQEPK